MNAKIKVLSINCYFNIDNGLQELLKMAQQESERVFTDCDCKVIFTYLLLKNIIKELKIPCAISQISLKNDYAKQLYNEIKDGIKQ